jgi:hypothetical protein
VAKKLLPGYFVNCRNFVLLDSQGVHVAVTPSGENLLALDAGFFIVAFPTRGCSRMSPLPQRALLFAATSPESSGGGSLHVAPRPTASAASRRRGRPPLCTPESVLDEIRAEAALGQLFRVHIYKPALYARARRLWGTWGEAMRAAGLDPKVILEAARQRAVETRRRRREAPPS